MDNFNGIISLLLFCIELLFLINLLIFDAKNRVNWLSILIIALLMLYQLMEFLVCYLLLNSSLMIYFAFVIISFLPPLMLILSLNYWGYEKKWLRFIYLPPVFFALYYLTIADGFAVVKCTVLYAIYNYPLGNLFGFFYYIPPLIAAAFLINKIYKGDNEKKIRQSKVLLFGLLFVFIPMIIALIIYHQAVEMIESLMCKFAFVLAVCLFYFALRHGRKIETVE